MAKRRAIITGSSGQNGSYLGDFLLDKNYEVHGLTSDRVALLTGGSGQDGSYLLEALVGKGYRTHSVQRRTASRDMPEVETNPITKGKVVYHTANLSDSSSIARVIYEVQPDEIYNLAAQSDVGMSFDCPEETADVSGVGVLRILEAVRTLGLGDRVRFYQASTSELFGGTQEKSKRESSPFYPRSPYAAAKLFGYWITVNYREAYGFHASNGLLFNHESPRRGKNFVTRKVTIGAAQIFLGNQACLFLGNLDAKRDWGHARDYVEAQWLILQHETPGDYVIATGIQHSVREFVSLAFDRLGISLVWRGSGVDETGIVDKVSASDDDCRVSVGDTVVRVDPSFYRPADVNDLLGDASLAKETLGWVPKTSFSELIREMVDADLQSARQEMHQYS